MIALTQAEIDCDFNAICCYVGDLLASIPSAAEMMQAHIRFQFMLAERIVQSRKKNMDGNPMFSAEAKGQPEGNA